MQVNVYDWFAFAYRSPPFAPNVYVATATAKNIVSAKYELEARDREILRVHCIGVSTLV